MQCVVVHLTLKGTCRSGWEIFSGSNGHLSTHLFARYIGGRAFSSLCILVSRETNLGNKIQTNIFSWNFLFVVLMMVAMPRKRRE